MGRDRSLEGHGTVSRRGTLGSAHHMGAATVFFLAWIVPIWRLELGRGFRARAWMQLVPLESSNVEAASTHGRGGFVLEAAYMLGHDASAIREKRLRSVVKARLPTLTMPKLAAETGRKLANNPAGRTPE